MLRASRENRGEGGTNMDDKTEGKFEQGRGEIKERLGGATGDEEMQGEGALDQVKGNVREGWSDVKDAVSGGDDERR
jgi:uncharacterized protein YjbJ (UPF0337 family)